MRLSLLTAIFAAAFFALPAQMDESRIYFSIAADQTVLPQEEAPVRVQSQGVSQLEFRLYRVRDPRAFFLKLDSPNTFGARRGRLFRPRTPIERFADWKRRQWAKLRDLARMQFTPANRARIRAWRQKKRRPKSPAGAAPAYAGVPLLNPEQLVRRWTQTVQARQPWEAVTIRVPLAEEGVYVLEATDQQNQAYTVLIASSVAAVTKSHRGQLAVRLVDRRNGEPMRACPLEVLDVANDRSLARGVSDGDGSATFPLAAHAEDDALMLLATCDRQVSAVALPGYALSPGIRQLAGAIHTDRPVYRPGQKVRFRAILREDRGGEYALPAMRSARVRVDDAEGNALFQKTLSLTQYGTLSGEFDLPENAPLGYFGIRIGPDDGSGSIYGGFYVEEYRKPEYEVRVRPPAGRLLQGGRVEAQIEARYYYGEPVPGAAVEWTVHRYRWYPGWWEWEDSESEETEEAFGGEQILEQKGQLDADGKLTIAFPVERGAHDFLYRIEARVTDEAGRTISGSGSFVATRANFLITQRSERWVYAEGETVRWRVSATDFDRRPVPDVPFRVELYRTGNGQRTGSPLLSRTGSTGPDGEAAVDFPAPAPGLWQIVTTAGLPPAQLVEEGWLWISGDWSGGPASEQVRISLDKTSYKPGETARVLVVTGIPRAYVWLTAESGRLHWSRFLLIEGGAGVIDVPVQRDWAPNVFLNAVFVSGNRLFQGSRLMRVPPVDRQILVELEPSRREFQPGEPASFRLAARDSEGRPLRAEFAVSVVDEAIYAIRREPQPDLMKLFYGQRWNSVHTATGLEFYFWGEAGTRRIELARRPSGPWRAQLKPERPAAPKVRRDFPDTAFWIAHLETDSQGRAEIRFAFPDSLTTWRATARGVTTDTKVGNAISRVLVRKDVVVSMAAPRFLNEGDEVLVPVLARNYAAQPLRARVSLKAEGLAILDGRDTEVEIGPRAEARVDYRLHAHAPGKATLTATAAGPAGGDAVEISLPVHPYGIPMSASAEARLDNTASTVLAHEFPPSAGPSGRMAEIRLAPSMAGALFGALEYLLEYPYGCTEQLMSGLLPNLVVAETLRRLKLDTQIDRRELDRNVKGGIERLYGQQNDDGSWGWWQEEAGSVFLTSYVLLGLAHAEQNGYAVDEERRSRAEAWLQERLSPRRRTEPDEWGYALLALAARGRLNTAVARQAWDRRNAMTGFGLAAMGLAFARTGDPRRAETAEMLIRAAKQEGEEMFWPSRRDLLFLHDADHTFEATAMAVRFLAAEMPDSPAVDRAARWLMNHRQRGYYWGNTKRTAFVIYGLAPLIERTAALRPDLTARVVAGGRELLRHRFTSADILSPKPVKIAVPVAGSRSEIRVETEGRGTLYVSANWSWRRADALEAGSMPETSALRVERRYYRLRRVDSGGRMEYDFEPWTGVARRGDLVAVHVRAWGIDRMNAYVMEDPLPAGAEPVPHDHGFHLRRVPGWWRWWSGRRELRDNRASWFPWWIPERGYDAVYLFRFTNAGRFRAAPARLEPMYDPGVMGWSEAAEWEVLP
ncbi:MAG: alpha-2-macroglobulin family protein [Bryobacteraceae bacterium]